MIIKLIYKATEYKVDLSAPLDISIPLKKGGPICFNAPEVDLKPVVSGDFVGSIEQGSPVNFFNVFYNPHGNGTHTESAAHIRSNAKSINQSLKDYHLISRLISLEPEIQNNGDQVITKQSLQAHLSKADELQALVIRTIPNLPDKLSLNYSGKNPPFLSIEAMNYIVDSGIKHLLLDLPSVDKEQDGGLLSAHHAFWNMEKEDRSLCTITEMIYVNDEIKDGIYLLNLMISPLELDAVSSKPVLYSLRRFTE